jgi:hypothetical protein
MSLAPVAIVNTLTLTPETAVNPVGTQHCVVATVTDQFGNPVVGVRVDFSVEGAHTVLGFSNTDANGQAPFCYQGTVAGTDTITASQGNLTDTASKLWEATTVDTCVRGDDWKDHPDVWAVSSLTLGSVTYSKAQLLRILQTPAGRNGLITLASDLIEAKLNQAAGASVPPAVAAAIAAADAMIASNVVPPIGRAVLTTILVGPIDSVLDAYNRGRAPGGPKACKTCPVKDDHGHVKDGWGKDDHTKDGHHSGDDCIAGHHGHTVGDRCRGRSGVHHVGDGCNPGDFRHWLGMRRK